MGVEGADDAGKGSEHDSNDIQVQDIDAYWLQREITKAVTGLDANEAQTLAEQVLSALAKGIRKGGTAWTSSTTTTVIIIIITTSVAVVVSKQMQWRSTTKMTSVKSRIAWSGC